MRVLKHYRLLRISLVLFAVVAQCVALVNLWLLLVSGTLVVLSWYVTEGPKSHPIPRWLARIAVGVAIFITLFNLQMSVDAIPQALGQFLVWLTIIKLFGERQIVNRRRVNPRWSSAQYSVTIAVRHFRLIVHQKV